MMEEKQQEETEKVDPLKYFEVEEHNKRSFLYLGRIINLELGIPKDCVDLYLNHYRSFPYLKLKKGAQVLFQNLSEAKLLELINQVKFDSDIKILSTLITSKEGKAKVATRLKELRNPH